MQISHQKKSTRGKSSIVLPFSQQDLLLKVWKIKKK